MAKLFDQRLDSGILMNAARAHADFGDGRQAIAPLIRAVAIEKSVIIRSIAIPLGTHPASPLATLRLVALASPPEAGCFGRGAALVPKAGRRVKMVAKLRTLTGFGADEMDEVFEPWRDLFPTASCFLVPDCYFVFDHWLIVMAVPFATAVAGGLLLPRWRHMFLVGVFCFVVHVAGQQVRSYIVDGELYYPRGVPFTIASEFALFYCIVMAVAACVAHAAKRLFLWAAERTGS